jgi:tRNA modification GTPase
MSDVIAAIATPAVPCAIGILRLSGEGTTEVLARVFRPVNGKPLPQQETRRMIFGDILDREGRVIDRGLGVLFAQGKSYTGESGAELYCHGSPIVLREALSALFAAGARQAKGGEFTQRAFLNGRMDLMQAESVIDLIDAETPAAARNAAGQINGVLSRRVNAIYDDLMAVVSRFFAVVDYPDDEIEDVEQGEIEETFTRAEAGLGELLATFDRGRILRSGVATVILGRPNVGKSSLLNALLGYDRAIVTAVPGTTRDTVEEKLTVGGVLLRLCDTAGIRQTEDEVESLGVRRTEAAAEGAALGLLVLDGAAPLSREDEQAIAVWKQIPHRLAVVNKADLPQTLEPAALEKTLGAPVFTVSARDGSGLAALSGAIAALFPAGAEADGEVLTSARQAEAAERALSALREAHRALANGMTPDAVLSDAEGALAALGELNGKSIREDLVSNIFSRFCVGK